MLRAILFSVCMLALGVAVGIAVGSYVSEEIILRECNLNGEYTSVFDSDAYITCEMED